MTNGSRLKVCIDLSFLYFACDKLCELSYAFLGDVCVAGNLCTGPFPPSRQLREFFNVGHNRLKNKNTH